MRLLNRARVPVLLAALALLAAVVAQAEGEPAQSRSTGVEAVAAFIAKSGIDTESNGWKLRVPRPPKVPFDTSKKYFWNLQTNVGNIKVELMPDVAPMHVSSTIYLTELGFYDDTLFHRVIPGFMAQGGDPTGTGRGGPAYKYKGEFDRNVKHDAKGMLSMANAGPGTDGSQFFLTFKETPHLDGKHTIFGKVSEGMGTLDELERRGTRRGKPSERMLIERATISVESAEPAE
jgi:cyclophilin family peptidyl-prolyl cis-trans isomerase